MFETYIIERYFVLFVVLCAVIAYLIGSVSFSYIFTKKLKGEDIRKKGSGNPGTTNMLRSYGWKLGVLTLVCDLLKGVLAAYIGMLLAGGIGLYIASVFAVVGHNYSCFLKFKGGKGIATTTGVLLVIQPLPTLIIFGGCIALVAGIKIMSIASLLGLVLSVVVAFVLSAGNLFWSISVLAIAILGIIGHRENIGRLVRGEERKFASKS